MSPPCLFWEGLKADLLLQCILRAVGVGGGVAAAGVVETGDVIELWRRFVGSVGLV